MTPIPPDAATGDPWHPEGIYQCNGCGRTFPEYNNGCPFDHPAPRKVVLVVPETYR